MALSLLKLVGGGNAAPKNSPATSVAQAENANVPAARLVQPGLKTGDLNQRLNDLRARLGMLVNNFKVDAPIGGFAPVFAALLAWIAEIWTDFQNQGCKALLDAYDAFREAKQYNPTALNSTFGQRLDTARQLYVEAVKTSALEFATRNRERWEALSHAQNSIPQTKRELWLHLIKMTGSDKTVVEPIDYKIFESNFKKWFWAIFVIEVVLGMFVFELKSNRLFAIGVAAAAAVSIMFSRHKASESKALINGHNDAVRNYHANYPGQYDGRGNYTVLPGVEDFEGNVVQLYPLSTTIRQTYVKAESTYWIASLGLLTWRCYVSYTDSAAGIIGIIGSLLVIAISSVYGWVTKYPTYQRHLQEKWQELVNDLTAAESDVQMLSKPDPDDPYQGEITAAKEQYFAKATEAGINIAEELESRKDTAKNLLKMEAAYEQAYQGTRDAYYTLWPQASGLCTTNPDPNFFGNENNSAEADQLFGSHIRPNLIRQDLLTEAQSFNPQVTLTFTALNSTELDKIAAEEEANARTQNSVSGGPAHGIFVRRHQ